MIIPEGSLREGANTVQLFAIEGGRQTPALRPLGGTWTPLNSSGALLARVDSVASILPARSLADEDLSACH